VWLASDGGGFAIDGGFSNNVPCLDSRTILVSATCPRAHINPSTVFDDTRIRILDAIRTPSYQRVWEIGRMAEIQTSRCHDLTHADWISIRRADVRTLLYLQTCANDPFVLIFEHMANINVFMMLLIVYKPYGF
jgi:hypothetical protein